MGKYHHHNEEWELICIHRYEICFSKFQAFPVWSNSKVLTWQFKPFLVVYILARELVCKTCYSVCVRACNRPFPAWQILSWFTREKYICLFHHMIHWWYLNWLAIDIIVIIVNYLYTCQGWASGRTLRAN